MFDTHFESDRLCVTQLAKCMQGMDPGHIPVLSHILIQRDAFRARARVTLLLRIAADAAFVV